MQAPGCGLTRSGGRGGGGDINPVFTPEKKRSLGPALQDALLETFLKAINI